MNSIELLIKCSLAQVSLTSFKNLVCEQASKRAKSQLEILTYLSETERQRWQVIRPKAIDQTLLWLEETNHHIISHCDEQYPCLLHQCSDAPPVLYVIGDLTLLSKPQLAMVGSRRPTSQARENAQYFARQLAEVGLIITSGLAMGVDAISHQGALDVKGQTIAVCGTGLDIIYPKCNRQLASTIAENGAIISEFPLGVGPKPYHFPKRNRIISGMSLGTLVVEASINSGSLITARLAAEQGREVFAIPSSIHNPSAKGCHRLIQGGAKLTESMADILQEILPAYQLPLNTDCPVAPETETITPNGKAILAHIDFEPTTVDVILHRSQLDLVQVSQSLSELELSGMISSELAGYRRVRG